MVSKACSWLLPLFWGRCAAVLDRLQGRAPTQARADNPGAGEGLLTRASSRVGLGLAVTRASASTSFHTALPPEHHGMHAAVDGWSPPKK